MGVKLANNAVSTLAASITDAATDISVQAADAGKFPMFAAGDWHPATLVDASGNMEIVRVTARAANVLTVTRAQEGTTAKAFVAGSRIDIRLTAGAFAAKANDADLATVAKSGDYGDLENTPLLGTAASNNTDDFATAAQGGKADSAVQPEDLDLWAFQPIGALIALRHGITQIPEPPKDKAYRYILLTAGQTGTGLYNEGVLTSEVVSGSSPNTYATGVISLSGSVLNGQTVRLINTERRFLRAGLPGVMQDSAFASHSHSYNDPGHKHTLIGDGASGVASIPRIDNQGISNQKFFNDATSVATTGITINANGDTETRSRNLGVDYYMRIK